jgi:hypothetical protein
VPLIAHNLSEIFKHRGFPRTEPLPWPDHPQTQVSSACSRSASTVESATLAAVATAVWMILILLSTPTWAFIPKYY